MNEFGRLLEKEIPRLRRYAFALTRNMSRADDLVQDTLVRAIAKQRCWQCGTNLRAWLFTIMHNQNVNVVRRGMREGIIVEVDDSWPFLIAPTDPTAALSLRDLDRALARISEQQRQVILLIGLERHDYMWATDYPHSDGFFPGAPQMIRERFEPLSPEARHQMLAGVQ
jgi:RNA polymerase sigma-70 factor, ECF subfamily